MYVMVVPLTFKVFQRLQTFLNPVPAAAYMGYRFNRRI